MENYFVFDRALLPTDRLVLENLVEDYTQQRPSSALPSTANGRQTSPKDVLQPNGNDASHAANGHLNAQDNAHLQNEALDKQTLYELRALNDPNHVKFEPTVFSSIDFRDIKIKNAFLQWCFDQYMRRARSIVRVETDVVMLTHLLIYLTTSLPSALYLFHHFSWTHGILHFAMQVYYVGTYTLMMHQHIHMRGILSKQWAVFDRLFPYITDPLMGHTWNSYFYHHVKHHHVESNGPNDLSSTLRYQRDDIFHFLHYVGRFFFFIWLELPLYFHQKGRTTHALKAAFWDSANYASLFLLARFVNWRATLMVFGLPLLLMRMGLMVGNWGQHAFVDDEEPDSDFRSSITLVDVASNRYCYNDGYHTSHHLNPLRHWREHPVSFIKQKEQYATQQALVFHNIDYIMITVKLLQKDYLHLAKCLVPMGDQIKLSLEERVDMLKRKTRQFSDAEIQEKFCKTSHISSL